MKSGHPSSLPSLPMNISPETTAARHRRGPLPLVRAGAFVLLMAAASLGDESPRQAVDSGWQQRQISATARDWWAFQPLGNSRPDVADADWATTEIDHFILAKLNEAGISPNPRADRRTLVRRAYFGLIGLPPTPDEVAEFCEDEREDAYERLIDKLLESPHYGERWARYWLDVARFAESHGFEQDYDRPTAYPYRDFVIQAFNSDMPYDQFVRWQVAGDELAPDEPLAWTATGFLGAGAFPTQLTEAEFEPARYDELDDMASTTGVAFLGVSIGCARCHDHKFDPIPQGDYYRFVSTFTTAIRSEVELELRGEKSNAMIVREGVQPLKHHADERGFPHFYPEVYFLARGDTAQKEGVATQGFPQVLTAPDADASRWRLPMPQDATTPYRRAALARWITDTEYGPGHLLARVIVNRLWQHHFGRGIVATPNDFGAQGAAPTHPELLDWLARELIRSDWRLKPIHKLLMTSSVYCQSSAHRNDAASADPENDLLWRWRMQRLEAEAIRDAMLAVSGLLDRTMFGPGTLDETMTRRSIYFFVKRSQLIPSMQLFDAPECLVSQGLRPTTTTAPAALYFMNDEQVRRCAEGLAAHMIEASEPAAAFSHAPAGKSPSDFSASQVAAVRRGYRLVVSREPTVAELADAVSFLQQQVASYAAAKRPDEPDSEPAKLALTDLAQVLLTLSEFIYVE
jgi:hypothetical protein